MAKWEYRTLIMGTPDKQGRRWVTVSPDPNVPGEQVGETEKPRFIGRIHQGMRLLETAIKEMDADGWEFVSHTFYGLVLAFYGTAVFRRALPEAEEQTD